MKVNTCGALRDASHKDESGNMSLFTKNRIIQFIIQRVRAAETSPFIIIVVILAIIVGTKLVLHHAWLASSDTPYTINDVTPETGEAHILLGQKININMAPTSYLEALPGIGPAIARRIGLSRPYNSQNDILRVRGIGPAKFAKIRHFIDIE